MRRTPRGHVNSSSQPAELCMAFGCGRSKCRCQDWWIGPVRLAVAAPAPRRLAGWRTTFEFFELAGGAGAESGPLRGATTVGRCSVAGGTAKPSVTDVDRTPRNPDAPSEVRWCTSGAHRSGQVWLPADSPGLVDLQLRAPFGPLPQARESASAVLPLLRLKPANRQIPVGGRGKRTNPEQRPELAPEALELGPELDNGLNLGL
jgi:hypothetical protein